MKSLVLLTLACIAMLCQACRTNQGTALDESPEYLGVEGPSRPFDHPARSRFPARDPASPP